MLESCPYLWRSFLFPGIFKDIGIINHDTVIEVQRSDLVAEHIGGTNAKTKNMLKKAEGRVLIVDEAYTLSSTSGKDYGKEAVEAMMAKMNANIDGKTKNLTFIFARYPCEMEDFLRVNPGLSRRIPNFQQFNDYTPMELAEITNKILLIYEMRYPHAV